MGLYQLSLVSTVGGCVSLTNQIMSEAVSVLKRMPATAAQGMSESFKRKFGGQLLTLSELLALCPSMCEMFALVGGPDCSWLAGFAETL